MATDINGVPRVDPTRHRAGLSRAMHSVAGSKLGRVIHRNLIRPLDGPVMRLTRGRFNAGFGVMPQVVLRTTGAKSGRPREVPVVYFTDGDDVVLIASNYGQTKHPSWYYNLRADPSCELVVGRTGHPFIARLTEPEDRDRLYALAESSYSGFTGYSVSTRGIREIQVFRLSPA